MDSLYSILKFYRILLNFHTHHISIPNNYRSWKVFNDSLFLFARLCVTKNCTKFATCSEWHIL